jgi:7-cyano-7-deazaguanine synthase
MGKPMNLLLLSGGVDSSLLFFNLLRSKVQFHCLHVSYGHTAQTQERLATEKLCTDYKIPLNVVEIPTLKLQNDFYVSGRNMILLGLAASHCDIGDTIYFGANKTDATAFPDCRQNFVQAMKDALWHGYSVQLSVPLLDMTKAEILKDLSAYKFTNYSYCYTPIDNKPCGKCLSCRTHETAEFV